MVHRVLPTLGTYKQSDFGHEAMWSFRYEQELGLSDRHGLTWGLTLARHPYDGEAVRSSNIYLNHRWRFPCPRD